MEKHLKKGAQVYVEGPLQTQKWDDKQGVTRYSTIIVGRDMKMLGKKEGAVSAPAAEGPTSFDVPGDDEF